MNLITQIERIPLANHHDDLNQVINDQCAIRLPAGLNLVSTFVEQRELVLIFQTMAYPHANQ